MSRLLSSHVADIGRINQVPLCGLICHATDTSHPLARVMDTCGAVTRGVEGEAVLCAYVGGCRRCNLL